MRALALALLLLAACDRIDAPFRGPPTHDGAWAKVERAFSPGSSWCSRCGRPWSRVEHHATDYGEGRGMFPLCERCWSALTPEERLPYYVALAVAWEAEMISMCRSGGTVTCALATEEAERVLADRPAIEAAVRAGR